MEDISAVALSHARRRHQLVLPHIAEARAATESGRASGADFVAALDTDGSDTLSPDEVAGSRLGRFVNDDNWTKIDSDGDGEISAAELDARHAQVMTAVEAAMTRPTTDV